MKPSAVKKSFTSTGITLQTGLKAFSAKENESIVNSQLSLFSTPITTKIFLGPASAHNDKRQQSHAALTSAAKPD